MFPGGQDMAQMLAQAQALQQQLADAQDELARTQVTGSAGGGLVTATVSGAGELLALDISAQTIDASDPAETADTIADLVVAAVRDATANVAAVAERTMGPLTEGIGGLGGSLGLGASDVVPGELDVPTGDDPPPRSVGT